ncbi:MAG: FAD-dependent oxidoreductase [Clostridia bacterium]|nr:FAD-dependent oxidoreductase [Clostridia bacterium]
MKTTTFTQEVPCLGNYDVCVVGGGPAGVAAAISAARNGMKTLLIEETASLGGMATAALVGPFMTCYDRDGDQPTVAGIYREILERTHQKSGVILPEKTDSPSIYTSFIQKYHRHVAPIDSFALQVVLDEMVREAGVELLCYTRFVSCRMEGDIIKQIFLAALEGLLCVSAALFIDCSGIAAVAQKAGVPTHKGDENSGIAQPATLMFEVGNVCDEAYTKRPERPIKAYRTPTHGIYKINHYHVYNVDAANSKSMTDAHSEARHQVEKAYRILKDQTEGFEKATLTQTASVLGVRESRHIHGEYTITVEDVRTGTRFDDRIAVYGFGMDVHNRTPQESGNFKIEVAKRYYIPYRSLLPLGCSNLLVAGKTLSCESQAVGGMRCMPAAMAMGQAAGTAAAIAIKGKIQPKNIDVAALQAALLAQKAILD